MIMYLIYVFLISADDLFCSAYWFSEPFMMRVLQISQSTYLTVVAR